VQADEKAEAERTAAEAAEKAKTVIQPSDLPSVRKPGAHAGSGAARPGGKANPNDPHGGVTSAGF